MLATTNQSHMPAVKSRRSKLAAALLAPLFLVASGCAVKPADKVAHGEDHNLFKKETLLGRPLTEVSSSEKTEAGVPQNTVDLAGDVAALLAKLGDAKEVVFDVGESYVTVNKVEAGATKPVLQFAVKGHFDLSNKTNDEGVENQFLAKDDSTNARWQDRAYVEIDPAAPLLIKADEETLRNLYAVDSLKDRKLVFQSAKDLVWLTPEDRAELIAAFGLKAGDQLMTTLSRRFFTLYKIEKTGGVTVLAQAKADYFDLVRKQNDKEEATPDLVRDTKETDWSVRAYVAIDPDDITLAKPTAKLMEKLYDKSELTAGTFKLDDKKAPLLGATTELAQLMRESAIPLAGADEVSLKVTEKSVDVYKGNQLVLKYAVLQHVDVAPRINDFGEKTAILELNTSDRPWQLRQYVAVDARDPEVVRLSKILRDNRHAIVDKSMLKGQCFAVDALPIVAIIDDVKAELAPGEESGKVCLESSQTVLSVFIDLLGKKRLLLTYNIGSHFDIGNDVSSDGRETASELSVILTNPRWNERRYFEIAVTAPQVVKDMVAPNATSKKTFDGEFLYTAVVTAVHSENGMVFTGWQLQSPDRLELKLTEDSLTAYKLNEKLNDSAAKSPVLRYSASHFDVQRAKNGYGDETNVIEENTEKPWAKRRDVRIDFSSNDIPSYFNDLLGLEKYYYGMVFSARSKLVGEVRIDDETISFDTEEIVTPNAQAGFSGDGETRYEPMAVKIRHTFLRLGKRGYAPKAYSAVDFQKFGYFDTTEAGLDPILGKTDDTLKHYMRRFDLSNGKHINYALSPNFPEKYKETARDVVAAWNVAFKAATGRDGVMQLDESGAHDVADPRVSMMVYVDQRHTQAPLGYGPSVFDPTTGENISGKSYIYADGITSMINMLGDFYDLVTGLRTVEDFEVATSPEGATTHVLAPLRTTPMARALPKTKTQALKFKSSAPVAFNLGRTLDVMKRQPNTAKAALSAEATKAFEKLNAELMSKLDQARRISAHDRFQGCAMDPQEHVVSAAKFILAHPGLSKAEVLAKVEKSMMFSLLLHEVGHTIGLRHNFHGSFDEASFSPKYFALRATNGEGAPAGEWAEKYRSSSTMDYLDDFEATDLNAGLYDVAAIKFGYGDKLERVVGRDENGAFVTEDMPKAEFDAAFEALASANPGASLNAVNAAVMDMLSVRPYKFCSDEHVENDPTCNRFDRGVTVTEITESLIEDYETRYQLYGFRRGRREFTGSASSIIPRFIMPVRKLLDEYVYNIINESFPNQDNLDGSPLPGSPSDYIGAINAGIDFFNKILETVEPGVYHVDPKTGELVSGRSEADGAKNLVVDLRTGKYLESRVETIGGRDERVLNRGIELDKIGVLFAMSLRGYPAEKYERAQLAVNYFDLIKQFTMERFSSVVREDLKVEMVAVKGEDGDYHPVTDPRFVFDEANPAHLKSKIAPSTSLAIREYGMIFAGADFDNAGNRTFADYIDYRIKGVDDVFPATARKAEFTSTSGLKTYVVADTADGLSISFKVASKAQETAAKIQAARDALAQMPDSEALKVAAIGKFGEAWAIGNGAPMGEDIVGILMGNFDNNLPIVRLLTEQFVADTVDPEQLAKITSIRGELFEILDQYEALAGDKQAFQSEIEDGERALTGYESDLVHFRDIYNLFK